MTPVDLLVETGTTLGFNCTLSDNYKGNRSANDIYFVLSNKTYEGEPYVTVRDSQTATLRLPDVQRSISGKSVFCYIPEANMVNHRLTLGQQVVKVAGECIQV